MIISRATLLRRRCIRYLSTAFEIAPQGTLRLNLSAVHATLLVSPSPEPTSGTLRVSPESCSNPQLSFSSGSNCVDVTYSPSAQMTLEVAIPEICNMEVAAQHLVMLVKTKFHGCLSISSMSGLIEINKARGHKIDLNCPNSTILVKRLEGNIRISGRQVKAQMLYGDNIHVSSVELLTVGSVYTKQASFRCDGDVTVNHMQGFARVESLKGNAEVRMIDGGVDCTTHTGNILLHFNKIKRSPALPAPSSAHACLGQINALVDPEIQASLSCSILGTSPEKGHVVTVTSDSFTETNRVTAPLEEGLERQGEERIVQLTGNFSGQAASASAKRPTFRHRNSSGKINTFSAEVLSLAALSDPNASSRLPDVCDIKLSAFEAVRVETVSWLEVIRRKYFRDDEVGPFPRVAIGNGNGTEQTNDSVSSQSRNSGDVQVQKTVTPKTGRAAQAAQRLEDLLALAGMQQDNSQGPNIGETLGNSSSDSRSHDGK